MAQVSDNVKVGYDGAVYVAPTGSTGPTDASTALDAAFLELGFLDETGVTVAHDDEVTEIKAWQRATVVRKTTTSSDTTVAFAMAETNKAALEFFYKKTMETGDDALNESGAPAKKVSLVIDVIDGTFIHRMYLASCEVTERGEITMTSEDGVGYPVTVTAYEENSVKIAHFFDSALT